MNTSDRLLLNNKAWAQERKAADPEFFVRLAADQKPQVLWIGCSDSRVPANQITGTDSGDIFVHRNIANLVIPTDLNLLSVVQYAVEVLEVKHVIVCGHHGCGGVKAAMAPTYIGPISHWLRAIREVHDKNWEDVHSVPPEERANRLCEWSVRDQVKKLATTSIIQEAWHRRRGPTLHGWVYSLSDGILKELTRIEPGSDIGVAYRMEF
jgi:carbonic anhydrase